MHYDSRSWGWSPAIGGAVRYAVLLAGIGVVFNVVGPFSVSPAVADGLDGTACSYGDVDVRVAACTRLIASDRAGGPALAWAHSNRGDAYFEKGDDDSALADYSDAIWVDPQNSDAFIGRGAVYRERGETDLALADYNEAIRLTPRYGLAYSDRGDVYRDEGNKDLALADYQVAFSLISKSNPLSQAVASKIAALKAASVATANEERAPPLVPAATPAHKREMKVVGDFVLTVEKDPFGQGETAVARAFVGTDGIALRCIENSLSVAILRTNPDWTEGDHFAIKFRADEKTIVGLLGYAVEKTAIEIADSSQLFDEMIGARSAAFRVESSISVYTFSIPLIQVDKVIAEVKKACGK